MIIYKSISKAEFAADAGITPVKLRKWMHEHEDKLKQLGANPKDKMMPPAVVKFLAETYQVFPRNAQII